MKLVSRSTRTATRRVLLVAAGPVDQPVAGRGTGQRAVRISPRTAGQASLLDQPGAGRGPEARWRPDSPDGPGAPGSVGAAALAATAAEPSRRSHGPRLGLVQGPEVSLQGRPPLAWPLLPCEADGAGTGGAGSACRSGVFPCPFPSAVAW